jgi:hypothetical protein
MSVIAAKGNKIKRIRKIIYCNTGGTKEAFPQCNFTFFRFSIILTARKWQRTESRIMIRMVKKENAK